MPPPPAPTITDVSPAFGSALGGTEITITGTNLNGTTSVTIDGVEVAEFTVVSNTSVLAITPAGDIKFGAKDVTLTANAFDATYEGGFTYIPGEEEVFEPVLSITSVSPASGSALGGTEITITGTGLDVIEWISIDGVQVAEFTVISDTSVLTITPAGTLGAKDVTVFGHKGRQEILDTLQGGFTYTLVAQQEETPPNRGGTPTAYFVSYVSLTAALPTNIGRWTTGETTIVGCDNAAITHAPIGNLISTQANSVSSIREAAAISSTVKYEIPSLVGVGQQFLYRFVVENRVSDSTVYGVPAGLEITNNSDGSATIAGIVGNFADVPVVGDQLGIPVKDLSESSYGSKSASSLGFAFNIEAVPTQAAIAAGVVYDADTYSWYTGNFSLTGGATSGIDAGLTFYVGKEGEFSISPISKNWSSERDRFILFYNPKDSPHTVDGKQIVTDKTPPYTYGGNVVERFVIDNLEYLQVQKSRGYFPNC